MNKSVYIIVFLGFISSHTHLLHAEKISTKIKSLIDNFRSYKYEDIKQKVYQDLSINSIAITNINGPITITTGWKKDIISLKATKRAKKETDLNNIKIVNTIQNNQLEITSRHVNPKLVGLVEYELIVPASLNINLVITENGNVCINDINGTINVVANDNITITNTNQAVSARTLKKGSISITNAQGAVNAQSHHGNIYGENIAHNFTAQSTSGKINVTYKTLPAASTVDLKTTSGNIVLALPTDTNAEIRGKTTHGTLISDHSITLKPYATQLNNMAWNKFKKEVEGTIGLGQATIALNSISGNVKIAEVKTT
jgi:hypothetical protein